MSNEEKQRLKEEIKRELMNELVTKQIVKDNAWKEVKIEFKKMFYAKGYQDIKEQAKIFNAIATITRISLGYHHVQIIPSERVEDIRQVMYKILNLFPNKFKI